MELNRKKNLAMDPEIENWDDEDIEIGGDDFMSRAISIGTNATQGRSHRDSMSSRLSMQSDFNSNQGDDERRVHLPGDDEGSTYDAIAAATNAGIPIPHSVPPSALTGGTIRRLGGRQIKKIIKQDDWDDDLELPKAGEDLKIRRPDSSVFPEVLRQVSAGSTQASPSKGLRPAPVFGLNAHSIVKSKVAAPANLNLEIFRDDESDDIFGDGDATIRVAKNRAPRPITRILPPTPRKKNENDNDDYEADLQLPSNGEPLKLSIRRDIPRTPTSAQNDLDEWGEGSLGTRFGGTRRDGRSNRSSSVSALSPSVSSSITIESEDEGLDGLILPTGPINFDELLKKRQQTQSPEREAAQKLPLGRPAPEEDDFLSGLEIGDGDVFTSNKLTMKRNVIIKTTRTTSPTRPKAAVSLVFTKKPSINSRLSRPHGQERLPTPLDPVSESGGPIINRAKRSQSRLGGHSAQSSITSIQTPTTPSTHSMPPSSPRRRNIVAKPSLGTLRHEPTTTSAQLLKLKRSMPSLRSHTQSPAKPIVSHSERPPSRTDTNTKSNMMSRPKTPVEKDRSGAESSLSHARRNPIPFLPAGASHAQSHHVTIKSVRHFRRHDSESSNNSVEPRPSSRAVSRSTMRSPSPTRPTRPRGAEVLARAASTKQQITKPRRPRQFGDGRELDGFDDLPTSQAVEQKFIKQPVSRGAPKSLRNKIVQNIVPDCTTTPTAATPSSPFRQDRLPRFARDTNASRIAREQVLSHRTTSSTVSPLTTLTSQWKPQGPPKGTLNTTVTQSHRTKRSRPPVQKKPHLIKQLGNISENQKSIKGMVYNPATFRWEGNENDLSPFDVPSNSPSVTSLPHLVRERESTNTPRPALITNINASQGVQVVGGMVFDPQRMCWLKVTPSHGRSQSHGGRSDASAGGGMDAIGAFEDEDDVFKGINDLEENSTQSKEEYDENGVGVEPIKTGLTGAEFKDDWLVGEEFDVGPEFMRRQREEEERWRKKCEKWVGPERDALDDYTWRWRIKSYVNELGI